MTKTPTNQHHSYGFYDDMLELSLGSLSSCLDVVNSLNKIILSSPTPSSSSEHLPRDFEPPRANLQRQSLSLPPAFSSAARPLSPSDHPREIQPPPRSLSLPSEFSPAAALPLLASPPAPARRYQPRQPAAALRVARSSSSSSKPRKRASASSASLRLKKGKSETITPPYEWATNRRATVHTLNYLDSKKIYEITGAVQCRRCESQYEIGFNLIKNFSEVARFIWENRGEMADRAPEVWMNPTLPTCRYCGQENSAKPVIPRSKKDINWLFLLLGQMLGCCTLNQLRYFCKHRRHHRTGAKDRVLYLTYLNLCKQLDPTGPFDR